MNDDQEHSIESIRTHWNAQAKKYEEGPEATFNDIFLMEKEIRLIRGFVKDDMRVLDAGCGNGYTAFALCRDFDIDLVGIDFSEEMVRMANSRLTKAEAQLKGNPHFLYMDILGEMNGLGPFDMVICKRVLINLVSWERQMKALDNLHSLLRDGGLLLLSEACSEGLNHLNRLRGKAGLTTLGKPWYNEYISAHRLAEYVRDKYLIAKVHRFSSTYYLGSRIVQPFLLKMRESDRMPSYTSRINLWSSHIPSFGDYGIQKLWVLRKTSI